MPPKKEITRDFILNTAYALTRRSGFESISTRSLAKELNCSTQPLYREFSDMQDIKKRVTEMAWNNLNERILNTRRPDVPEDLGGILAYIQYALEENNLFRLIVQSGMLFTHNSLEQATGRNPLPDQKMIIFANGLIMMTAYNAINASWDSIRSLTIEAYEAFSKANESKKS